MKIKKMSKFLLLMLYTLTMTLMAMGKVNAGGVCSKSRSCYGTCSYIRDDNPVTIGSVDLGAIGTSACTLNAIILKCKNTYPQYTNNTITATGGYTSCKSGSAAYSTDAMCYYEVGNNESCDTGYSLECNTGSYKKNNVCVTCSGACDGKTTYDSSTACSNAGLINCQEDTTCGRYCGTSPTKVNKPTCNNATYDGNSHTLVASNAGYSFPGQNPTQTKASDDYSIAVRLNSGYVWNDGSDDTVTLHCSITRKSVTATISSCTNKSYDGDTEVFCSIDLSGVVSGDNVLITKTCDADSAGIGTHNVTCSVGLSGAAGSAAANYALSSNRITKANAVNITTIGQAVITCLNPNYTGSRQRIASCQNGTISDYENIKTNAGTYTVNCVGDDNYSDATATCEIKKVNAVISCSNPEYTGSPIAIATCSGGNVSNETHTNAGNYTVSCVGDSNHNDVTKSCEIKKAKLVINCVPTTYDGYTHTIAVCSGGTISNASQKNRGSYDITCTSNDNNHEDATPVSCSITSSGSYKVTLNSNGGTIATTSGWSVSSDGKTATKYVEGHTALGTLPEVTKEGTTFSGWNTSADGSGTSYTSTSAITGSRTLYAVWTDGSTTSSFTVTLDANGGTIPTTDGWTNGTDNKTATKSYDSGAALGTLPAATKSGTTLSGWNTKADGSGTAYTSTSTVTSEIILYAIWANGSSNPTTYKVTLDANGGTLSTASGWTNGNNNATATKTYTSGTALGTLPGVTKTGTTFSGWNTKSDGTGTTWTSTSTVTSEITLYAIWANGSSNPVKYTVVLNANGGNIATTNGWTITTTTCNNSIASNNDYDSGSTLGTLPVVTKTGTTFSGWNTKADGTGTTWTSSSVVTGNITLYAIWANGSVADDCSRVTVIRFDCNGGTGSMDNMTVEYGTTVNLIPNTCSKVGHSFNVWLAYDKDGNMIMDSTGTNQLSYIDGGSLTNTYDSTIDYITLKAQWDKTSNTYVIHYDANGGTGSMSDTIATIGAEGTLRANAFSYSGHKFASWAAYYKDSNGNFVALMKDGVRVTFKDKDKFIDLYGNDYEEVTLFAQWIDNPKTGIIKPTLIILAILGISGIGYYFSKKKNNILE